MEEREATQDTLDCLVFETTSQVLEVQINDRLALTLYFMLRFFFLRSGLCYSARERLTPIGQPSSANTPTHELGVPPAAVLPILIEHTVLLETFACTETRAEITC